MGRYLVWAVLLTVAGCGSTPTSSAPPSSGGKTPTGNVATPVSITNSSFSPSSVTIKMGASVKWTNDDVVGHTSTSDAGVWNSGQLSPPSGGGPYSGMTAGGSYTYTFSSAGTFNYHCANHTYMTGTVTVTP